MAQGDAPQSPTVLSIGRLVLQLFITAIVLAAALGKALNLSGFIEVLRTYQALPEPMLLPLAILVTSIEFILGGWLLSGWRLQDAALAAAGLNIGYAVWMLLSLLRGLKLDNCGCFGVFFPRPLTWVSPVEDLVLAELCFVLRWLATRRTA